MTVRIVPRGTMGIPMPALIKGDVGRKLQGGLPPEPYRGRNVWTGANRRAMSDGTSKACQSECFHSTSEWDRTKRQGMGAWVPA